MKTAQQQQQQQHSSSLAAAVQSLTHLSSLSAHQQSGSAAPSEIAAAFTRDATLEYVGFDSHAHQGAVSGREAITEALKWHMSTYSTTTTQHISGVKVSMRGDKAATLAADVVASTPQTGRSSSRSSSPVSEDSESDWDIEEEEEEDEFLRPAITGLRFDVDLVRDGERWEISRAVVSNAWKTKRAA